MFEFLNRMRKKFLKMFQNRGLPKYKSRAGSLIDPYSKDYENTMF